MVVYRKHNDTKLYVFFTLSEIVFKYNNRMSDTDSHEEPTLTCIVVFCFTTWHTEQLQALSENNVYMCHFVHARSVIDALMLGMRMSPAVLGVLNTKNIKLFKSACLHILR